MLNLYPELSATEVGETLQPLRLGEGYLSTWESLPTETVEESEDPEATLDPGGEDYPLSAIVDAVVGGRVRGFGVGRPADPRTASINAMAITSCLSALTGEVGRDLLVRSLCLQLRTESSEGKLRGSTPEERYQNFVRHWPERSSAVFAAQFPVTMARLRTGLDLVHRSVSGLVSRLEADRALLATNLGVSADDQVIDVQAGGDSHNGGQRVALLTWASGARLVYKPRSVAGERAWSEIVSRFAEPLGLPVRAARVLDRGDHGWMAFVPPAPAATGSTPRGDSGARRAPDLLGAREAGVLGALLYALNAQDMHFENIISAQGGPVPVDLETILHPSRLSTSAVDLDPPEASFALGQSVAGMGVLPMVLMRATGKSGSWFDVGFLGDRRGQGPGPWRTLAFRQPRTDTMAVILDPGLETAAAHSAGSRAPDDGGGAEAPDVSLDTAGTQAVGEAFMEGFSSGYEVLRRHRDDFFAIVAETATGCRLRYVHNPTILYTQVLRSLTSPLAGESLEISQRLAARTVLASRELDPGIVSAEIDQVMRGDVPYFVVTPERCEVKTTDGAVVAVLAETPLDQVRRKIAGLGDHDLRVQRDLIASAFAASIPDNHLVGASTTTVARGGAGRRSSTMSGIARCLAAHLCETQLTDRFPHLPRTWIGPLASAADGRPWPPGVLGYDLYTGRSGVGLALAAAGRVLDDAASRTAAHAVFGPMEEVLAGSEYEERNLADVGLGAYSGLAGMLWALHQAGSLLEVESWTARARTAAARLVNDIGSTDDLDLIRGGLGTAAALLPLTGRIGPVGELHDAVLARMEKETSSTAEMQSGFAHGVAGVLDHLARWGDDRRFARLAPVLWSRLQPLWVEHEQNWITDTRGEPRTAQGWCHGRAGLTLALAVARARGLDVPEDLLPRLVRKIAQEGLGYNLTYCHGDLGNRDILRALEPLVGEVATEARQRAETRLSPAAIQSKLDDRKSRYSSSNSLLVGTSGVLLHLCSRLDPTLTISPILLAGPVLAPRSPLPHPPLRRQRAGIVTSATVA